MPDLLGNFAFVVTGSGIMVLGCRIGEWYFTVYVGLPWTFIITFPARQASKKKEVML